MNPEFRSVSGSSTFLLRGSPPPPPWRLLPEDLKHPWVNPSPPRIENMARKPLASVPVPELTVTAAACAQHRLEAGKVRTCARCGYAQTLGTHRIF